VIDVFQPTGVRGHGLLDDDMSVLPGEWGSQAGTQWGLPSQQSPYEFYNVDVVYDFLVSIGVKPVVELSFMPKALVTCGTEPESGTTTKPDCVYSHSTRGSGGPGHGAYKGLQMPPDDYNDWFLLVRALGAHLVERYGLEEVASWHFEVWNEMQGLRPRGFNKSITPPAYMKLFNASSSALKSVSPKLRVGGPATMQLFDLEDFLVKCKAEGIAVDFVTTHLYPTCPECQSNTTQARPDCFSELVLQSSLVAKRHGLPFLLTEYNAGLGGTNRDDASGAAFLFRNIGILESLDMFSFWTFSDIFEEGWMRSAPFHNGFGMMTVSGVRKPVWRAFELLMHAGTERLKVTGNGFSPMTSNSTVSVLATKGGKGAGALGLQLFVANYRRLLSVESYSCDHTTHQCVTDQRGDYTDEGACNADCRTVVSSSPTGGNVADNAGAGLAAAMPGHPWPPPAHTVTIHITHSAGATVPASAIIRRIDSMHANAFAEWTGPMANVTYPTKLQMERLDNASALVEQKLAVTRVNAMVLSVTFDLPPEDASVHISL
jgi:beta-xylosidase